VTSHATWFVVLLIICVGGPYALGMPPASRRQWTLVAVTIAFLAWVLLLMAPLRSK
jgi:hypothetical protein